MTNQPFDSSDYDDERPDDSAAEHISATDDIIDLTDPIAQLDALEISSNTEEFVRFEQITEIEQAIRDKKSQLPTIDGKMISEDEKIQQISDLNNEINQLDVELNRLKEERFDSNKKHSDSSKEIYNRTGMPDQIDNIELDSLLVPVMDRIKQGSSLEKCLYIDTERVLTVNLEGVLEVVDRSTGHVSPLRNKDNTLLNNNHGLYDVEVNKNKGLILAKGMDGRFIALDFTGSALIDTELSGDRIDDIVVKDNIQAKLSDGRLKVNKGDSEFTINVGHSVQDIRIFNRDILLRTSTHLLILDTETKEISDYVNDTFSEEHKQGIACIGNEVLIVYQPESNKIYFSSRENRENDSVIALDEPIIQVAESDLRIACLLESGNIAFIYMSGEVAYKQIQIDEKHLTEINPISVDFSADGKKLLVSYAKVSNVGNEIYKSEAYTVEEITISP